MISVNVHLTLVTCYLLNGQFLLIIRQYKLRYHRKSGKTCYNKTFPECGKENLQTICFKRKQTTFIISIQMMKLLPCYFCDVFVLRASIYALTKYWRIRNIILLLFRSQFKLNIFFVSETTIINWHGTAL